MEEFEGLEQALPKGYLSWSQISSYLRCPMIYYNRYVLGLKIPPKGVLLLGGSLHKTFEIDLSAKKTNIDYNINTLQDIYDDAWNELKEKYKSEYGEIDFSDEPEGQIKDAGYSILPLYREKIIIKPEEIVAVERSIEFELDNQKIIGYVDVELEKRIKEFKTTKRSWNEQVIFQNRLQTILYSIYYFKKEATKKDIDYDIFIRLKQPKHQNVQITIDTGNIQKYENYLTETVKNVINGIKGGVFPRTGMYNYSCSWCGYRAFCHDIPEPTIIY
jgi:CRISPR/Cas system-associated exonuclease Cas4 (RecB family)